MSLEENPYLAPATAIAPSPLLEPVESLEEVRRRHLNHEASVRSVGTLYLLGGILTIVSGIYLVSFPNKEFGVTVAIVIAAIGALQLILGNAIRRLQRTARIVAAILAAPSLLAFPIGTLISILVLYLMLSRKGAVVFSDEYKQVIAQTPHIKYKTSVVVWILLALFGSVVLAGLVFALIAA
jgi:hypothetical protein